MTADQWAFLRRTARKTWYFFETFVTAEDNWLPPDNFQEVRALTPSIASRTSPTNMGLALLANLAARDLGYLSVGGLIRRTQDTLATMQRLERHRGHFYNWYDTRTLQPLLPLYVSSVDSGNLAGHLLTLAAGLREQADENLFTPQVFAGLRDTVIILRSLTRGNTALATLDAALARAPSSLRAACALLETATDQATMIAAALAHNGEELQGWAQTLQRNCEEHLEDLRFLASWLALPGSPREEVPAPPGLTAKPEESLLTSAAAGLEEKLAQLDQAPTLREVAQFDQSLCPLIEAALQDLPLEPAQFRHERQTQLTELSRCLREASDHARQRLLALETLARQSDELAAMDFTFLFDAARDLFSIGFNVTERRCDTSFYDLLASEARLCGYVAIALGQVPQKHWFSLGRLLVAASGAPILVSWSGSMFEYLMPLLVMPNYENTLLDHTCKAAVQRQIEYGQLRGAVGHFRIGLQPHGRSTELPIPRFRCAGPGFETRTGRGLGDRSLRHCDGADDRAVGSV